MKEKTMGFTCSEKPSGGFILALLVPVYPLVPWSTNKEKTNSPRVRSRESSLSFKNYFIATLDSVSFRASVIASMAFIYDLWWNKKKNLHCAQPHRRLCPDRWLSDRRARSLSDLSRQTPKMKGTQQWSASKHTESVVFLPRQAFFVCSKSFK